MSNNELERSMTAEIQSTSGNENSEQHENEDTESARDEENITDEEIQVVEVFMKENTKQIN